MPTERMLHWSMIATGVMGCLGAAATFFLPPLLEVHVWRGLMGFALVANAAMILDNARELARKPSTGDEHDCR